MFALSIKGNDYWWLRQALERGDLALAKATASQLPALNLTDSLALALLVIEQEPHNAERAALRWVGRFCLERRDVTLAQAREAVDAFALLVEDPDRGEAALRKLAQGG